MPWSALLPFAISPLLLLVTLTLAANRQTWVFAQLLDRVDGASWAESKEVWFELNEAAITNLARLEPVRNSSALPTLELWINRRSLGLMQDSLRRGDPRLGHEPGGNKPYVDARLRDERGRLMRCEVSYRGLTPHHHWAIKPSLRVKIKRADVREGRRYLELQRPEDALLVGNALPEALARKLGVLSNLSDPVRLFINRRPMGVYLRTVRPGEALSREQGRLPGTFLKGDAFSYTQEASGDLFSEPGLWKREGKEVEPAQRLLRELLVATRAVSPAAIPAALERVGRALDADAYARWSAVMVLTGSTSSDAVHNHVLFTNTYRGLLEPVLWDTAAYARSPELPIDLAQDPITSLLSRDPRWVHARNEYLYALIQGPGAAPEQTAWIHDHLKRALPDLLADPNLGEMKPSRLSGFGRYAAVSVEALRDRPRRLTAWVRRREAYLRKVLSATSVNVRPDSKAQGRSRVQVWGVVGVRVRSVDGALDRVLYPGLSSRSIHHERFPGAVVLLPTPASYTVSGAPETLIFTNAITGSAAVGRYSQPRAPQASRTVDPTTLPSEPTGEVTLGPGEILLTRDLVVGPRQVLLIQPGTTVRLAPGVGIYSRGEVRAEGREDAPIRLLPMNLGGAPWACLGIVGAATAGTRLRWVEAQGGSTGTLGGVTFKGMLSVYGCPDLLMERCTFRANRRGDDAVNLAQTDAKVLGCTFEDVPGDGLDLDRCTATIVDSAWRACGNDGLDLMESRVRVEGGRFTQCADKGISVGEASVMLLTRSEITDSKIGVELKDASVGLVVDSSLRGNGVGLHAYAKKWSYGYGGTALLLRSEIEASRVRGTSLEPRSSLYVSRSHVDSVGFGSKRVHEVDELPPQWATLLAEFEERP